MQDPQGLTPRHPGVLTKELQSSVDPIQNEVHSLLQPLIDLLVILNSKLVQDL